MDDTFGGGMFGGPLFVQQNAPPPPPPPYSDDPSTFRIDFEPDQFKRRFMNYVPRQR